jgi:hypothetical protein
MGAAHLRAERFGEAIGPLRRAAELGADSARTLPGLAVAFFRLDRLVASWAVLRQAAVDGIDDPTLRELESTLRDRLPVLKTWERWCRDEAGPAALNAH